MPTIQRHTPTRLGVAALLLVLLVAGAACSSPEDTNDGTDDSPAADGETTAPRDPSQEAAAEKCIEEDIEHSEDDPVVGADLAAWQVEDLLPPPLRTAGLQSNATTIMLDGEPVGDVLVEETEPGIFVATGFTYCVPADVELANIDVVETFGGAWQLIESTPELDLPEDAEMELTIREGYFGGWAACNEYSAHPAAGPDGQLRLSNVFFTEAGCVDDESVYQDLLRTADQWALEDGQLVLSGPEGELRYASVATRSATVSTARVSSDGRQLMLGIDICQSPLVELDVDEGPEEVRVHAVTTTDPDQSECAVEHTVTLDQPLADRTVVDVATAQPLAVQPDQ